MGWHELKGCKAAHAANVSRETGTPMHVTNNKSYPLKAMFKVRLVPGTWFWIWVPVVVRSGVGDMSAVPTTATPSTDKVDRGLDVILTLQFRDT